MSQRQIIDALKYRWTPTQARSIVLTGIYICVINLLSWSSSQPRWGETALRRFCVQEKTALVDSCACLWQNLPGPRTPGGPSISWSASSWEKVWCNHKCQMAWDLSMFVSTIEISKINIHKKKSSIGSWNWSSPPWVPQRRVAPCWQQASEEVASHQCKVYQTPWESKSVNWVMSDELIGWSYEITRPSVNYAKDWLDHSFHFPGLVWSEKEFLWMGQSTTIFLCIRPFLAWWQTNERTAGWS